jgi:hypothetical protein
MTDAQEPAARPVRKRNPNDIKEIRNVKQLEKVNLDYESPRLTKAMHNLGISIEECRKR